MDALAHGRCETHGCAGIRQASGSAFFLPARYSVAFRAQACDVPVKHSRVLVFLLCSALAMPLCAQPPQRIVSLNLCTDLLLLELLPREHIAAVTELAPDPVYSLMAHKAQGLPIVRQDMESILGFQPDLVLATRFSDPYTVQRLQSLGVPVRQFDIPATVEGTRGFIREVSAALGRPVEGERLLAQFDQRWQALGEQAAQGPHQRVMLYRPGGVTMGRDTLEDAVLQQAGMVNVAAEMGYHQWTELSLEAVLQAKPDAVLLDDDGRHSDSLAQGMGGHPALQAAGITSYRMAHKYWICPGPHLADAVTVLRELLL